MQTRPLSPHLQIYKWQLTSVLSIVHRGTGIFLSFGTLLLCAFLFALASDRESYENLRAFTASTVGVLLLVGWSYALIYHLLNGIRHLFWDAGYALNLRAAYIGGWIVVVLSFAFTAAIWFAASAGAA